jgi:hypothetical protein
MRRGSVTLGDLVDRIAMLEVACSRCKRHGRLQVDRLLAQYGDMELPELGRVLAGDCPKDAAFSISDRCDVFFPKLGAFLSP